MMICTLRTLREESGKDVKEVADKLGVCCRAVYKYERGERHISLEQVLILSKLYGVTAEEVIQAQLNSRRYDQ
jgi:predicted transcriptional regulator